MEDNTKEPTEYVELHKMLKHFSIARWTAEQLIREGMPMLRVGKRIRRFNLTEVKEWLKNRSKGQK